MEQALRSHRGGAVLALGIVSAATSLAALLIGFVMTPDAGGYAVLLGFVLVPVALAALLLGWRERAGMRRQRIDPTGRRKPGVGQVLAAWSLAFWAAACAFAIVSWPGDRAELLADGTIVVSEYYRFHRPRTRYGQTFGMGGVPMRHGESVSWYRNGQKSEEGSYLDGKRDGEWMFWNEDGSMDLAKSGVYENDVRVQSGRTPPGDYPHDY